MINETRYELKEIEGQLFHEDSKTGELIPSINVDVPIGTIFRTPAQQESARQWKKKQQEKALKQIENEWRKKERRIHSKKS